MVKSLAFRNNACPGQLSMSLHTSNNINIVHFRCVFNTGIALFPLSNGEQKGFSPRSTSGKTRETLIIPFSLHRHGLEIKNNKNNNLNNEKHVRFLRLLSFCNTVDPRFYEHGFYRIPQYIKQKVTIPSIWLTKLS